MNNVALVPVVAALSRGKYVWSINRAWLVIESKSARRPHSSFGRSFMHTRSLGTRESAMHFLFLYTAIITTTTPSSSFHSFIPNGWRYNHIVRSPATTRILYCAELWNVILESCTYGRSRGQFAVHKFLSRINHGCDLCRK